MKKKHEEISSVEDKARRSHIDSNVPNRYLSPNSKEAKLKSSRSAIKSLKEKNQRLLGKITRYEFDHDQTKELYSLVKAINGSGSGKCALKELCEEAEATGKDRGKLLSDIWKSETEELDNFFSDQESNSKCLIIIHDYVLLISCHDHII